MRRTEKQRVSWIMGGILLAPVMGVAASDSPDQLESIIVVGQKENQEIQRAPEAITALPAEILRQNSVKNAEDLGGLVPSLVIGESDGYNFDLSIRGIGLNSPQDDGSPPSVSVHQNGIFMPNPVS
ncbi:MAG: TonB-dependent receptor, partial [Gammaproteobacteria bacterium]|nr:TonB-dependent receptor [Gammaproteobacteria bacterium]